MKMRSQYLNVSRGNDFHEDQGAKLHFQMLSMWLSTYHQMLVFVTFRSISSPSQSWPTFQYWTKTKQKENVFSETHLRKKKNGLLGNPKVGKWERERERERSLVEYALEEGYRL